MAYFYGLSSSITNKKPLQVLLNYLIFFQLYIDNSHVYFKKKNNL